MTKFLSLIVSGGVSGAVFGIMASGLVLTYGTSGTFNFSHGAIAFAVSFFYFQLHTGQGLATVPAALISVLLFAPLLGLALDRILFRRLASAPVYARIVGTIAMAIALPNLILWITDEIRAHGGDVPEPPFGGSPGLGPVPAQTFHLFSSLTLNSDQLIVLAASAATAAILWGVLQHSRLGLQMRADVDRRELTALRGVNPSRTSRVAWVLSTVLAGLGGILLSPFFGVEHGTYTLVVFGSIAAVVVAGLRSLPLAFAGGLLLGILANLVAGYSDTLLPDTLAELTGLRPSVPFVATVVGLLILGRRRGRTAGTRSTEAPPPDPRLGQSQLRRLAPWIVFGVLLVAYILFVADDFWTFLVAKGLAFATIFLSFVVVTGMGAMVSLSQATFVTASAFAAGWLINHQFARTAPIVMTNGRVNFLIALLAGALVAMVLGALIALPVRRLSALPLALATLSLAFIADLLVFQVDSIRAGSQGYVFPPPSLGPFDFADRQSMAVLAFAVFCVLLLGVLSLQRSATGRAMYAVRSSEVAARACGLSPERTKTIVFAVSAGIAGIGGTMLAVVTGTMTNTTAPPTVGLFWLAIIVVWGVRRVGGALVAGLAVGVGADVLLRITDWNDTANRLAGSSRFLPILFSIGAIQLAMQPDGILALMAEQRAAKRAGRAARSAARSKPPVVESPVVEAGVVEAGVPAAAGPVVESGVPAAAGPVVEAGVPAAAGPVVESPVVEAGVVESGVPVAAAPVAKGPVTEPAVMVGAAPAAEPPVVDPEMPAAEPPAVAPMVVEPALPGAESAGGAPVAASVVLTVEGLRAGYGQVDALRGVDLVLGAGRMTALLGPNGAGKSTLCAALAGLVPTTGGRILHRGRDLTAVPAFERTLAGMFLVPETRGIFPGLSVEDNLAMWLPTAEERDEACERFPALATRRRDLAGLLSGGEQQMLSMVSALVRPPDLLIADEPTLGLAPLAAESVHQTLVDLKDAGVSILLVEEKSEMALSLADEVAILALGSVLWQGATSELDDARLAEAYLGKDRRRVLVGAAGAR